MSRRPNLIPAMWLLCAIAYWPQLASAQQPAGVSGSRSAIISSGLASDAQALPSLPAHSQLRMRADDPLWNSPSPTEAAVRTAEHTEHPTARNPVNPQAIARSATELPLKPSASAKMAQAPKSQSSTFQMLVSVGSSLLLVLGLIFGVAWCYRKTANTASSLLPNHVLSVLGRTPLATRQHVVLLRFGPKLVLVSVAQGEARTISEITDPLEVDKIAGQCESTKATSISNSFRSILHQVGRES